MVDPARSESRTILVVDDDTRNRDLLRAWLEPHHAVIEACDGPAALDRIARDPVDLVILDVMMPRMSGYDVCRAIKHAPRNDYLPVLLLTSLSDQEERTAGLTAGADDFLSKPVDRRELLLRVGTFLRLREQDRRLRRQYEALRLLDAMKEDLFSLLVHDLRNPLSGILGYADLLRVHLSRGALEAASKDAESVRLSAQHMAGLLEEILQIRLIEEGQVRPQPGRARLQALLEDATQTVAGAALVAGVRIAVEASPDLYATLDPKLTRRCVENLLSNAVKYAPRGSEVKLEARPSEGGVVIEVSDAGPGVPDALKQHMFEKYGSIEARQGGARKGFGLGLHLVRLVADAHGGHVKVRNREGGGSIFSLWYPQPAERSPTDAE